jgi:mono/diheme cytochrome c family protein
MEVETMISIRLLSLVCVAAIELSQVYAADDEDWINKGRYLVKMSGCNECHTDGYARSFGKIPESELMAGRAWGEMGVWGTTFPVNVRLLISELTEQQWIDRVRHIATRPPMPWYDLRVMTDDDLRAIYRFISSLGVTGKPAPAYLPPGDETTYPHVTFPAELPVSPRTGKTLNAQISVSSDPLVIRGRYLVQTAWCNSCHTQGYFSTAGEVPEDDWLQGSTLGRFGAWGTTYATNLRLYMQDLTEQQWVEKARTVRTRPTMPWFALNEMKEEDLRAIYRYTRALGPAGVPVPAYLPPEMEPTGAYVIFPQPGKK